ncbi:MAG: GntR family transcriptional regulator [Gemmataceae bacterium]
MRHKKPASTLRTEAAQELARLHRSPNLLEQVESILRQAIAERRFADDRLPTEMELAEQLGVSRETVRRATEVLKREGLLVKYRRKGTFIAAQTQVLSLPHVPPCLDYLQARYDARRVDEEAVCRAIDGAILQRAIDEAGGHGMTLLVQHLPPSGGREVVRSLAGMAALQGMIFASCDDEKLIRSTMGRGVPVVLVDHDFHAVRVSTVRDDSHEGSRLATMCFARHGDLSLTTDAL